MKNIVLTKTKWSSWRKRIVFYSLIIFLIFFLFFGTRSDTEETSSNSFIPQEIYQKRFEYSILSPVKFEEDGEGTFALMTIKNNSYVYDLKDVIVLVEYFSDKELTKLIKTENYGQIESIPSQEEYTIKHKIADDLPDNWWVSIKVDNFDLEEK